MTPAVLGLAAGWMASLGVTRLIEGFLFVVSAKDPITFCGSAALLGFVALLARMLKARRGVRECRWSAHGQTFGAFA